MPKAPEPNVPRGPVTVTDADGNTWTAAVLKWDWVRSDQGETITATLDVEPRRWSR